jgi:hypothetical protein
VSVKPWASRLSGIDGAKEFRGICESNLLYNDLLLINMAGIKDITPGFAYECFGKLYLEANKRGSRIKFTHTPKHLRPIVLSGIKAATRL